MKKIFAVLICLTMLAVLVCGCSGLGSSGDNGDSIQNDAQSGEVLEKDPAESGSNGSSTVNLSSYVKPAAAVSIDLTKADPSNGKMNFVYDEEGRVSVCYYRLNDKQVSVTYSYDENSAQIYAFMGDVLVADELISLSGFDKDLGFCIIDGYYFKGYASNLTIT